MFERVLHAAVITALALLAATIFPVLLSAGASEGVQMIFLGCVAILVFAAALAGTGRA